MPSQLIPHDTPPGARPPDPARPFAWEQAPWGWVLTCPPLAPLGRHGFTIRDLDPGRGVEADAAWVAVAAWLDVPLPSLWRLDQVHGCRAVQVDAATLPAGDPLPSADAAITTRTDVAVAVKAADCVPILMAHPG
ncbi:MAG: laccase domain-containing protein, partial [Vicinamibacteria bacterium]